MRSAIRKPYASPDTLVLGMVSENLICNSETTKTIIIEEITETPYNWDV